MNSRIKKRKITNEERHDIQNSLSWGSRQIDRQIDSASCSNRQRVKNENENEKG